MPESQIEDRQAVRVFEAGWLAQAHLQSICASSTFASFAVPFPLTLVSLHSPSAASHSFLPETLVKGRVRGTFRDILAFLHSSIFPTRCISL